MQRRERFGLPPSKQEQAKLDAEQRAAAAKELEEKMKVHAGPQPCAFVIVPGSPLRGLSTVVVVRVARSWEDWSIRREGASMYVPAGFAVGNGWLVRGFCRWVGICIRAFPEFLSSSYAQCRITLQTLLTVLPCVPPLRRHEQADLASRKSRTRRRPEPNASAAMASRRRRVLPLRRSQPLTPTPP